jgi:hypothetical protein
LSERLWARSVISVQIKLIKLIEFFRGDQNCFSVVLFKTLLWHWLQTCISQSLKQILVEFFNVLSFVIHEAVMLKIINDSDALHASNVGVDPKGFFNCCSFVLGSCKQIDWNSSIDALKRN